MLALAALFGLNAMLCHPLNPQGLSALVQKQEQTKVVFFASWCSDCKTQLASEQPPGTIFVAAFDEQRAAEAVVKAKKLASPCYMDDGIADQLGIKAVPAVYILDREGRVKSKTP